MSENTFDPQEINLQLQPLPTYIDSDGAFKLNTPMLSSFNFNGMIPKFDGQIFASDVKPGYFIQIDSGEYFPVVSIEYDEDGLEDAPSNIITINYIDDQGNTTPIDYNDTDLVFVIYEDWDEKILGNQGWGITSGGNAIFSNVAVRGRIEATEGSIDGDLTLGGSFTASTDIGFVKISASGILGATASGLFHLDTATGEIDLTGNITATSGQIKSLNIGPNNYPIIDITGINTYSGQFIMRTPRSENFSGVRKLEVNDIFKLNGVISSSSCIYRDSFFNESTVLASEIFNSKRFVVLSASFTSSATYTYLCQYKQRLPGEIGSGSDAYNFSGVTASSGSFNIGYLYFGVDGNYTAIDPIAGVYVTAQEGIIFETYKTGEYPDYIDLSGRFKLGGGKLTYDGATLSIDADLAVGDISASYVTYNFLSASYADLSELATSGTTIISGGNISTGNIKSTGYSGPGTGSAFATTGMLINLDQGSITSKNFRVDDLGNLSLRGDILVTSSGTIGGLPATGSVAITQEAIFPGSAVEFPAVRLNYNYSGITYDAKIGFTSLLGEEVFLVRSENNTSMHLSSGGNTFITSASNMTINPGSSSAFFVYVGGNTWIEAPTTIYLINKNSPEIASFLAGTHGYTGFYVKGSLVRSGYYGWSSSASNTLTIANELTNGNVNILTNGAGRFQAGSIYNYNITDSARRNVVIDSSGQLGYGTDTALTTISTNAQTGSSYTLVASDAGKLIEMNNANANFIVIPLNSSVPFSIGTKIDLLQTGVGATSASVVSGVTLNSEAGKRTINAQWQAASLIKSGTDTWVLVGALKA